MRHFPHWRAQSVTQPCGCQESWEMQFLLRQLLPRDGSTRGKEEHKFQYRTSHLCSISLAILLFVFFLIFFNWRIIALQCCIGFCCKTMQINHDNMCISPLLSPHPPPIPSLQVITEHRVGLPALYSSFPLVNCFMYDSCQCYALLVVKATFKMVYDATTKKNGI